VLIALQGVAMAIRSILVLGGRADLVPERMRYNPDREPPAGTSHEEVA